MFEDEETNDVSQLSGIAGTHGDVEVVGRVFLGPVGVVEADEGFSGFEIILMASVSIWVIVLAKSRALVRTASVTEEK